jgi:hypothetical protein
MLGCEGTNIWRGRFFGNISVEIDIRKIVGCKNKSSGTKNGCIQSKKKEAGQDDKNA